MGSAEPGGRQIYFGVREHGMAAVDDRHGAARRRAARSAARSSSSPTTCRPAVRLAAISEAKVIYSFTHDSVGVGEDGPTHQPVEQLASIRAIPGLRVIRPADANETAVAWRVAVGGEVPVALILSRQDLPVIATPGAGRGPHRRRLRAPRDRRPTVRQRRRPRRARPRAASAPAARSRCALDAAGRARGRGAPRPRGVDAELGPVRAARPRRPGGGAAQPGLPTLAVEAAPASAGAPRRRRRRHRPLRGVGAGRRWCSRSSAINVANVVARARELLDAIHDLEHDEED